MTFRWRVAAILFVLIVTPAFAGAQTFEPPRMSIGGAGGVSNPLHGDLQFVAPSWDVSVRGQVLKGMKPTDPPADYKKRTVAKVEQGVNDPMMPVAWTI